jgi:aminodeoxychorismate lyase
VCIPATDRSYLFGDGLFETILVKDNQPIFLAEHLTRLQASGTFFDYDLPPNEQLAEDVHAVIAANAIETGSIRLTVSQQESQGLLATAQSRPNILITYRRGSAYTPEQYQSGFHAIIAEATRRNEHSPLSVHKTANYADNILARKEALGRGADEAILINTSGNLTEGSVANLFLVKDQIVLTPLITDGVLPGILRQKVLGLCDTLAIARREETLSLEALQSADEAFLTNSLMGIMPLATIEGYTFDLSLNSITRRLETALSLLLPGSSSSS